MKFKPFAPIDLKESLGPIDISHIKINEISPNPDQPRKHFDQNALIDLSKSIKEYGVFNPILVKKIGKGSYEIIAGERRWRASKIAGIDTIPVIIQDNDSKKNQVISLIENVQREDLNPLETARSIQNLIADYDLSHDEVSVLIGKSRSTVSNFLRILKSTPYVQNLIEKGLINMGHAKALLTLSDDDQCRFGERIANQGLSVREAERILKKKRKIGSSCDRSKENKKHPKCEEWKKNLERELRSKVSVNINNEGRGEVVISIQSLPEIQDLMSMFSLEY